MDLPISLKIANAKGKILSAVNLASVEYNLPAFILEGILADILSEVRSQAQIETLNNVNILLEKKKEEAKNFDNEKK